MTLNTMLYDHINEGIEIMSVNYFRDESDPLKEQVEPEPIPEEELQDLCYMRWQMFDEIPERVYTIQCEDYFDKNDKPLDDEESIKHLTSGEHIDIDDDIELHDEYGNVIDYMNYKNYYYCMNHNKYDLSKITMKIRSTKFVCEEPIGSGKSTAIRKWISVHKTDKFMVIVPTVNITEE